MTNGNVTRCDRWSGPASSNAHQMHDAVRTSMQHDDGAANNLHNIAHFKTRVMFPWSATDCVMYHTQ